MADYYWIYNGTTAGNFQTAANWSQDPSGSPASATIPQADDFVHFGHETTLGNNLGRGSCELASDTNAIARLTLHEDYVELSGSSTEINFLATGYMTSNAGGFDFVTEGFKIGMHINITGAVIAGNNGLKQIAAVATNSVQFTSATGMANETGTTNTVSFTYSPQFNLNGNDVNLTSPSAGTLLTIHGKIVATSASNIFVSGTLVSGTSSKFILVGDNADFNDGDITLRITGPAAGSLSFDDGEYPATELNGNSFNANYTEPTSSKYNKTIFNKFKELTAGTWTSSGTRRDNVKKTFEILDTSNFALRSTLFDTGESKWILNYSTNTLNVPVDGDYTNYPAGFKVRWYNLEIGASGLATGKALIPARRSLQVNSLTIRSNAKLVGEFGTAGTSTVCSTTRPTILGSWNFSQVADGIYSSTLNNSNPITPSHGNAGYIQFSYDGGAFMSSSRLYWDIENSFLQTCDGAYIRSSFYEFCQSYGASVGTGQNNRIWISDDTPSVLYYTDSAGTHHNLLAGGGGGGMTSWTLQGDSGSNQTITDGNTVDIAGGTGISTVAGATDTLTVNLNAELNDLTDVTITGTPTDLQVLVYDGTEWVNGWPEVKMIQIRNDEGSTIPAGAPLYSRGEIGGSNRILVGIADANDSAKMPCIGIAYEEMNTTTTQDNYGVVSGVYNTNLTGFTGLNDGDTVYVKNWTGTPTAASDVLTTTKPTGADEMIQNIGIILKTNSPTGTIIQGLLVSAIGRSNDIPNYLAFQSGAPTPAPTNTDVHIGYGNPYTETLSIRTQYGYLNLGARNAGYCHFYTDRNFFYFNRPIQFDGGDGVYAYNGDFWVRTDDASAVPTERLTIKGAQNDTRVGIAQTSPQTELDVSGTIRQTNVTNAIVHADGNGDLGALTVGTGLSLVGSTLSATGGGGGGGGYPLFKHDQLPTTHGFTPFRLLQNGDSIELGVVSGGDDNKDVSVFTPENSDSATIQVGIVNIGTVAANTGREYIFYGQGDRMMTTQYIGGTSTAVPIYFVESMRDVVLPAGGLFTGKHILEVNPMGSANCVRVIDAGVHSVLNASSDGGEPEPEEASDVRILLIDDYKLYVDLRGGIAAPNYTLRT